MKKFFTFLFCIVIFSFFNNTFALNCNNYESICTTDAKINGEYIKECCGVDLGEDVSDWDEQNFENSFGIKRKDRIAGATKSYNCHSQSYNNRYRWISYPNNIYSLFKQNGKTSNVNNAKKGDRGVIFAKNNNGKWKIGSYNYDIIHSFIFLEDYKGDSTKIQSKYGSLGEYKHSYNDVVKVYKYGQERAIITSLKYENGNNFSYRSIEPFSNKNILNFLNNVLDENDFTDITDYSKSKSNLKIMTRSYLSFDEIIEKLDNESFMFLLISSDNKNINLLDNHNNLKFIYNQINKDKGLLYKLKNKIEKHPNNTGMKMFLDLVEYNLGKK